MCPDCQEMTGCTYVLLATQKHPVWLKDVFRYSLADQTVATLKLLFLVSTSTWKNLLSSRSLSKELNEGEEK